jgi:hypothetical protein
VGVCVVVPFRGGCAYRERAWEWVRSCYAKVLPGAEVYEETLQTGPWIKAIPVRRGLLAAPPDSVCVVADADVWSDGIEEAIERVEDGRAFARPYFQVHRLTEDASEQYMAGRRLKGLTRERRPYPGVWGGGVVVAKRETLLETPMDPRFVGWGQEDEAWGWALKCLHGTGFMGRNKLVHLHHSPQPRETRKIGSPKGGELRRRYQRAARDPVAMTRLLEEAHDAHTALEHSLLDPQDQLVGR